MHKRKVILSSLMMGAAVLNLHAGLLGTYEFTDNSLSITDADANDGITFSDLNIHSFTADELFSAGAATTADATLDNVDLNGAEVPNASGDAFTNGQYLSFTITNNSGAALNLEKIVGDLDKNNLKNYFNARIFNTTTPTDLVDDTIARFGAASGGTGQEVDEALLDGTSVDAGSSWSGVPLSLADGASITLNLPFIDSTNSTSRSLGIDNIAIHAFEQVFPAPEEFHLPVEVLGVEGTTESQTFSLSSDYVNNADKIFFMMNNLGYENKGSIQINGGAWISLNHTDIDIYEKEMYYGGMQHGGMNSIRFTIPSTDLVVGDNTINFRFDVSNGISMGYRVIKFNLLDSNGAELLPESFFVHDDPNTWSAPVGYDSAADVTAGADLWYNGQLVSHNLPNGRNANWYGNNIGPQQPIKAKCTDCHTQNGRDLEYFSYSNRSIIERSKFHGLTDAEGSQIAAYIRSLNVPRHGRPWNPPYQPGPELANKTIEHWAAGAGLDAVLETDADMLAHMLPNGTSQEEVDKFFDLEGANDTTIMPVSIQFPDWKHWLPLVHPKDAFDGFYSIENPDGTFSPGVAEAKLNPFVAYPALRAYLETNDHAAIVADKQALYDVLGDFWKSHRKFFTKEIGKGGGWRYSNTVPDTYMPIQEAGYGQLSRTSLARHMAVKFFEIHQEFQLEELIQQLEPEEEQPQPRQWLHASGYNVFEVPPHFTAGAWGSTASYEGQPWITGVFETTSWYELQLIINPGNGKPGGTGPVDFNYHPGFISKASGQGKPEPMRYARAMSNVYQVKGVVPDPDPSKRRGFRMLQMGPNKHINWDSPNYTGTGFIQELENVETGLTAKVMSGLTSMMADALHHPQNHPSTYGRSNTPSQFSLHPETKMDYNPDYGKNDYSDIFYRMMPEYLAIGVDPLRVDRVIDWAETAWPLMPWDDIRPFPSVAASTAKEGANYSANLASFISDIDITTAQSITKINGPQWLIVGSDGSLSGYASNGSVGPNSFTIEIVDTQGVSHLRAVKILVNGSADAVTNIAHKGSGGQHLGGIGSDAVLSDMTAESLAVDGDRTSAYSQWVSDNSAWPHWIEIDLEGDNEIMKLEFWSGEVVSDFQFQQWNGSSWVDVITETGNTSTECSMTFTPVTTNRVRFYATAGTGNVLSLKEINVYIEELIEVNGDEDGGEDTTELVETNVAVNKPTTVDSGAGLVAGPSEEWNVLPASAGYVYLQHRLTGERLSAANSNDVELVASSVTGNAVEWELVDIDGTWSYIISRSEGRKFHASSGEGYVPNLTSASWTGNNVRWRTNVATPVNQAPVFSAGAMAGLDADEEVAYSGSLVGFAADADGDSLSYTKVSGPGWLTIAPDGTLGGTPVVENVGLNSWTVGVDDGNGGYAEVTFVIDVIPVLSNLALNKTVTVDSRNRSDQAGSYAVDGNNTDSDSRWVSDNDPWPHWVEVDLDGTYTISRLELYFTSDGKAGDFQFQHWDGSQWLDILSETGNTSNSYIQWFTPVTTTKIRLYATAGAAGATDDKLRLYEIEVYGKEPSNEVPLPNIALNKPVLVDSLNSSYPGSNAVDGNNSDNASRWVSANSAWPHWIEVDLQGTYDISRVKFWTGYNGYDKAPTDFQFQRWDGSAWVDIFTDSGNTDPIFSRTFTEVRTDRVRLYATAGEDNYFRLYEIEVFGEAVDVTPPAAPAGLAATAGENAASLDWDDNGESDFASYTVYRSTASGSGYAEIVSGLTDSSYNDSGLTNDTTYYYVVTASDAELNESANSAEASATPVDMTPPSAPSSLTAAEGIGAIALDWSDNAESDLASYTVYRSTTSGSGYSAIASGLSTSEYDDLTVSNHVDYYYVVTASDTTGNESNSSAEAQAQAGVIDYSADSETAVLGSASGGLAQVESHDDVYQTLTEVATGNTSGLEHKWEFDITGAELVTFYVEAYRSATSGSDDFIFAWSTDDVNYTDMVTVTGTVDDDQAHYFMLPSGQTGTIHIRVLDSDRSTGDSQLDSLTIDALYIVSAESSVAPQAALSPALADGATEVASNVQLSWFAGLGAASHDVYFGTNPTPGAGEFQGNQAGTTFDPGALSQGTTYYWGVNEANASGTTSGFIWSFTTVAGSGTWIELTNDDFESGWGNWVDGGSDAQLSSSNAIGTQCMNLQDDSSSSLATLATSLNLSSYTQLQVEFSYVVQSFENAEAFWVQFSSDGGSSWTTVKAYVNDVDFVDDGTCYDETVTLDSGSHTFNNNVKIRLRCDASGNGDDVYIDNVVISGLQ